MTLIFSSVTYALKAQKLLASEHIRTALTRSPAVTAVRGCGYGLRLASVGDLARSQGLLASADIAVIGVVEEGRR